MRILLIEDDQLLGDASVAGLKQHHYSVDWITDGEQALSVLQPSMQACFDAIILVGLPKKSGFEVLKVMRERGITTPTIILTARNSIQDKVNHLDLGADDYLTKPFDLAELCARLRSITRRNDQQQTCAKRTLGDVIIDQAAHKVFVHNEQINFSRREFTLLSKLIEQNGRVVTRDILSQALYGWGDDIDSNAIEVHIHHIRKKVGTALSIKTVRGIGYIVEAS